MLVMAFVVALLTLFFATLTISTVAVARRLVAQAHGRTLNPTRTASYPPPGAGPTRAHAPTRPRAHAT